MVLRHTKPQMTLRLPVSENALGAERNGDATSPDVGSHGASQLDSVGCDHEQVSSEVGRRAPPDSSPGVVVLTLGVEHRRRSGRLMLDRGSSKGEAHGLVFFDDDGAIEDLPLTALKLVGLEVGLSSA